MRKMVVTIAIILSASLTWADEPSQSETQAVPQTGELYGRVSDKATHQPLPAVSVLVEGSRLGASTDIEGKFRIERVPVGSHNVRFMMIGYETLIKSNVVANPGRETRVEAELREVALGMAGAGGLFEGPLSGGKGSYLLSARKSYLDLLISSWGLTAVPRYYNLQGKVVYDLNVNNKLLVNAIYGKDRITIEHEQEEDAIGYVEEQQNVRTKSHQYAAGVTLRSLWSKGFSDLTISRALSYWNTFVYDASGDPYYTNQSTEAENTAKFDGVVQLSKTHEISAGVSCKQVHADHNMWADPDTIFVWSVVDSASVHLDTVTSIHRAYPDWEDNEKVRSNKVAGYAQYKWRPGSRITVNIGLRYDRFAYHRPRARGTTGGTFLRIDPEHYAERGV